MDRRTFLKVLGGTAAGVAAAPLVTGTTGPLFIPAKNLDFGVPTRGLILSTPEYVLEPPPFSFDQAFEEDRIIFGTQKTVPMMLLHDNYIPEHGGRLKAGSIVWEDEATAGRWGKHNVAVRCDGMQPEIIPGRDYGRWDMGSASYRTEITDNPTSVAWIREGVVPGDIIQARLIEPEPRKRPYYQESSHEYESTWLTSQPDRTLWGLPLVVDATMPDDTVTLKSGDQSSVTITNIEASDPPKPGKLQVVKRLLSQGWVRP